MKTKILLVMLLLISIPAFAAGPYHRVLKEPQDLPLLSDPTRQYKLHTYYTSGDEKTTAAQAVTFSYVSKALRRKDPGSRLGVLVMSFQANCQTNSIRLLRKIWVDKSGYPYKEVVGMGPQHPQRGTEEAEVYFVLCGKYADGLSPNEQPVLSPEEFERQYWQQRGN